MSVIILRPGETALTPEETAAAILENESASGLEAGIGPLAQAYLDTLELLREKDARLADRDTVIAEHNQTIAGLRSALAEARSVASSNAKAEEGR